MSTYFKLDVLKLNSKNEAMDQEMSNEAKMPSSERYREV